MCPYQHQKHHATKELNEQMIKRKSTQGKWKQGKHTEKINRKTLTFTHFAENSICKNEEKKAISEQIMSITSGPKN